MLERSLEEFVNYKQIFELIYRLLQKQTLSSPLVSNCPEQMTTIILLLEKEIEKTRAQASNKERTHSVLVLSERTFCRVNIPLRKS